jgi:hypothetical protein
MPTILDGMGTLPRFTQAPEIRDAESGLAFIRVRGIGNISRPGHVVRRVKLFVQRKETFPCCDSSSVR